MRTVLIVDDEREMRKRYKALLKANGFKVFEARDAIEVANILMREKSQLEVILLDINIAELDGRDIFDIIDQYAPNIPIIVNSIYPINDQKLRIPRATDYFNKAQKDEVLLKKIKDIMGVPAADVTAA